jgi:chromosome segregation ATPase
MYNLIKLSLHNWYVIDAQDIPIFKNTAIIGQTGAGKSSILDAIQTIISGNNRNIIELNAAAGEKRGRTVKDYILGKVSDFNEGKPRRDNCESTIVMTMYDESKNKFLCLGLMFQASEETNEKTKRFIIEDYDFSIEDFISKDETVLSHKEIISIIEKDNYNIEFYSNSIKFVSAYLEKVRPVLTPNPKHFLRSFSNTLQAKEISNPTEFVRKFVLEPIDLNITGIRKSIQNWKELSQEVENIETKIIEISEIYNDYQKAFKFSIENLLYKEENLKKKINQENSSILNFENILLDAESELDLLKKEKNELKSKLSNTQFNHNSIDLKNNINTLKNNLSFLLPSFSKEEMDFISKIGFNFNPNLIEKNSYNQLKDLNELLNNSIEESYKEEKEIKSKLEYNNNLLDSYKNNESIYSKHTKQFMELLDVNNIYYINVIDTISIINNKWSDALEILLGLNKEAFLFKNDSNEKKAFNILEKYKSNLFKVRIISNIKLDNLTEVEVSKHSISNFLEYENKQIEKFIKHQIGYFIATEKYEDLNKLKYAIMPSGKSTSGLIKRVHSQPMKQIKQKDLSDINISDLEDTIEKQKIEFNTISNRKNLINICFQKIKQIKDNFEAILDTQNQIEKFEINNKKTEKEQNNNNFEKLQNDLENIQEKINSKDVTILMNKEKIEQSKINIKNIEAELLKIIQEKESDKYKFYSDLLKNINTTFDNNIKTPHKDETIFNIFQNANTKLMKFSQKWIVEVPLSDNSTNIERLQWISEESDKLINSELRQYRERLIKAKEEMETALKSGLLSQLLESFDT